MSDHTEFDMTDNTKTYEGFIRGSIYTTLVVIFVCIALLCFAFGNSMPLTLGTVGIVVGTLVCTIDLIRGTSTWGLSIITLVVYGLVASMSLV